MDQERCWATASNLIAAGDVTAAIKLCESSPCSQKLECQRFLAMAFYRKGQLDRALEWFSRAADQGDVEGLFGMASVHHARKEFSETLRLYKEAADRGYARAYHWIASMYQHGLGVPTDLGLAMSYYEKSKAHGYLVGERGLNHLASRRCSGLLKLTVWPRHITLFFRTLVIAARNNKDQRLTDIPNGQPGGPRAF